MTGISVLADAGPSTRPAPKGIEIPVNVYKRSSKTKGAQWEVIVSIGGRMVRQQWSLGRFRTKKLAEDCREWAEERIAKGVQPTKEMREGSAAGHSRSVRSAAEQWITTRVDLVERTRQRYASIIEKHGHEPLWAKSANRVTREVVQAYVNQRIEEGASPGTIRLELIVIRCALDYVGIAPNPASDKRVRRPSAGYAVDDPPTEAEVRAIIQNIAPKHRLAVAIAQATGLRISEICWLRWSNIDWSDARADSEVQDSVWTTARADPKRAPRAPSAVSGTAPENRLRGVPPLRWTPDD